jgi:hypothetical protein
VNLVDRENGNAMMIMFWEAEEHANRPLADYGPDYLKSLTHIAAISSGNRAPIRVWEVTARV